MSTTTSQTTDISPSNLTSIFGAATKEYKKLVKKDLHTHSFAAQFCKCDSPQAVLDIFQRQSQAFEEFRKGDDRLMKWLDPIANVLFVFSATLGEALALVVSYITTDFPCHAFLIPSS
jgi:thiamine kinase-like enzyme